MRSKHSTNTHYVNLYFQVHQPRRLGQFSFFDIGTGRDYFDDGLNQIIIRRVAHECYLPTNLLLLKLISLYPNIRVTFSISGTALTQLERFAPASLESFRMLAATGSVEFLSETYYHSLACFISPEEFARQVSMHRDKIRQLFEVEPAVFRNTELIYSNEIGKMVYDLGFTGIFADGSDFIMGQRNPNNLYNHPQQKELTLFFRNCSLSDDIAFRFMQKNWSAWPLTPKKFTQWLELFPIDENITTIGIDYETFGEHQKRDTGIFQFLEGLITTLAKHKTLRMTTPSEAIKLISPKDVVDVCQPTSWADREHDLSAWLGNEMQQDAFETLKSLGPAVLKSDRPELIATWRYLQTSDHLYYMSTKTGDDGNVHSYFSPYASPYEAFMNYMNIVSDFSSKVQRVKSAELTTSLTAA